MEGQQRNRSIMEAKAGGNTGGILRRRAINRKPKDRNHSSLQAEGVALPQLP